MDLVKDKKNVYFKEKFNGISLSNDTIKLKEFESCLFEKCSFIECVFDGCKFIDCKFEQCVLSAIKPVNSSFFDVKFDNSKAIGVDWTKTSAIRFLQFENSQVNYSNFSFLKLPQLKLVKCEAKDADFGNADLKEGDFRGTDFGGAVFLKTNLTAANFEGAYNYLIDFRFNTLKKTMFSTPEVINLLRNLDIIIDGN